MSLLRTAASVGLLALLAGCSGSPTTTPSASGSGASASAGSSSSTPAAGASISAEFLTAVSKCGQESDPKCSWNAKTGGATNLGQMCDALGAAAPKGFSQHAVAAIATMGDEAKSRGTLRCVFASAGVTTQEALEKDSGAWAVIVGGTYSKAVRAEATFVVQADKQYFGGQGTLQADGSSLGTIKGSGVSRIGKDGLFAGAVAGPGHQGVQGELDTLTADVLALMHRDWDGTYPVDIDITAPETLPSPSS